MQEPANPLIFDPDWIVDADSLLQWMQHECRWQTETISIFGKRIQVPRRVAWFGVPGLNYRYSGIDHRATGWPEALLPIKAQVAELPLAQWRPTFLLANCYQHGQDYMGWHRDDEPQLCGPVVSASLGAPRRFLLEQPQQSGQINRKEFLLGHGALLVHPRHWRHSVPKTRISVGLRINMSFRCVA